VVIKKDLFVYGILYLSGLTKRVQIETLCLEIDDDVFHGGIVKTVSFT
jgi:hypothetical protein